LEFTLIKIIASKNIKSSGFSLAKRKELMGDDFYDVQTIGNLTVAIVCDGVGSAEEGAAAAKRTTTYLMNNKRKKPNLLRPLHGRRGV